jgi:hypothetical protein
MKKFYKYSAVTGLAVAFVVGVAGLGLNPQTAHAAQAPVDLKSAAPFAILAGTPNITDAGN